MNSKLVRIEILSLLLVLSLIAGWFVPKVYHLRSAPARVIILAVGVSLWYSVFQGLAAWDLKRRFS